MTSKTKSNDELYEKEEKNDFPDFYDKKLELKLGNDIETLSKYHKHLKKLGWASTYSPSSGMTWRKKTPN